MSFDTCFALSTGVASLTLVTPNRNEVRPVCKGLNLPQRQTPSVPLGLCFPREVLTWEQADSNPGSWGNVGKFRQVTSSCGQIGLIPLDFFSCSAFCTQAVSYPGKGLHCMCSRCSSCPAAVPTVFTITGMSLTLWHKLTKVQTKPLERVKSG